MTQAMITLGADAFPHHFVEDENPNYALEDAQVDMVHAQADGEPGRRTKKVRTHGHLPGPRCGGAQRDWPFSIQLELNKALCQKNVDIKECLEQFGYRAIANNRMRYKAETVNEYPDIDFANFSVHTLAPDVFNHLYQFLVLPQAPACTRRRPPRTTRR